jgi:3-hydroxyacyl-[acyl-carrier-protein] dehydratase
MQDALNLALSSLPHGHEFRFVDRLLELEPGISGTAEYTVRGDEHFLRGHFPNEPMMPGVLLLEAVAQLAGAVAQSDPAVQPLSNLRLTAVRGAKIVGTAAPGETLSIKARILGRLGNLVQAGGTVEVEGRVIVETDLTLSGNAGDLSAA